MKGNLKTDMRLLAIIDGGRRFAALVDPDGLLGGGRLRHLAVDGRSGTWACQLTFPNGEALLLRGTSGGGTYTIGEIRIPLGNGRYDNVPCEAAETLAEALGPLDGIPARLKGVLSPTALKRASTETLEPGAYLRLLDDALLWNVEVGKRDPALEGFNLYKIDYRTNERGTPCGCAFRVVNQLPEGRITITADADVYGLGEKKVILEKNLGMLRSARVECLARNGNGNQVPSLKAAFDLYDAIPILYQKQRREKIDIGRPKAKTKTSK